MDELQMMRAFVAATQLRSFSRAAESFGVTTGAISKAVSKLEERIQTRLLHRTTRSITLTDEAQSYYRSCSRLIEEWTKLIDALCDKERSTAAGCASLFITG
jgi:DNA-binding transcriptional LysR family regulator